MAGKYFAVYVYRVYSLHNHNQVEDVHILKLPESIVHYIYAFALQSCFSSLVLSPWSNSRGRICIQGIFNPSFLAEICSQAAQAI